MVRPLRLLVALVALLLLGACAHKPLPAPCPRLATSHAHHSHQAALTDGCTPESFGVAP